VNPVAPDEPEFGVALALFRIEGVEVERYAGLERWIVPPFAEQVLRLDISGAGGGWAGIVEVTSEEEEEIKWQLFDKDGNRRVK